MNVYDFDGTIYSGDSSVDFYLFALRSKPSLIRFLPRQLGGFCGYGMRKIHVRELKSHFFSFLRGVDTEKMVQDFWRSHIGKIEGWYLNQKEPEDIVISASPYFLLKPICNQLGIRTLIATEIDPFTGEVLGENCKGIEKLRRLTVECGVTAIDCFYSDSISDLPLAQVAEHPFLVKKGTAVPWNLPERSLTDRS